MRRIKFRGKDCDTGKWHYGDLLTWCGAGQPQIKDWSTEDFREFDVEMDTVGQLTGLHDNNGKDIYEGDIVLMENVVGYGSCKGVVKWDDNRGYWYTDYKGDYDHRITGADGFVIGNIHDNPELLKGGEQ